MGGVWGLLDSFFVKYLVDWGKEVIFAATVSEYL